ncbi:hypothetical protein IGI04_020243, partial [Brassica rapa subsp. trilocularis]
IASLFSLFSPPYIPINTIAAAEMSSSDAQIAHAAVEYSTFASLRLGRTDSVIHAFIPANRASHYRPSLKAGCIVRLERFEVTRVAHMYKVTEHQFLIRFLPSTHLGEVHTHAPVIKSERFMMRRYDQPRAPRYNTIRNIKSFTERIKGSGSQGPMNDLYHYENSVIRGSNSIEKIFGVIQQNGWSVCCSSCRVGSLQRKPMCFFHLDRSHQVLLTEGTDNRDDKTHQERASLQITVRSPSQQSVKLHILFGTQAEVGQAIYIESASNIYDAPKISLRVGEASLSGSAADGNKRPRE